MNKTKRTLIVSSLVMALTLIVTIVSVTAAWFSNTASSQKDGFTIDSTVLSETADIKIDEDMNDGSNTSAWPAVAKPGVVLAGDGCPRGAALKETGNKISRAAKSAVFYFPINVIGTSDTDADGETIDGRKSMLLDVVSAKIATETVDEDGNKKVVLGDTDYLERFNVEMCIVTINADKSADKVDVSDVDPANLKNTNNIYYYQNAKENGDPQSKLYMLIVPGESYYVQATVYFNEVDEKCEDLLYLTGQTLRFDFKLSTNVGDVNIRQHKK